MFLEILSYLPTKELSSNTKKEPFTLISYFDDPVGFKDWVIKAARLTSEKKLLESDNLLDELFLELEVLENTFQDKDSLKEECLNLVQIVKDRVNSQVSGREDWVLIGVDVILPSTLCIEVFQKPKEKRSS